MPAIITHHVFGEDAGALLPDELLTNQDVRVVYGFYPDNTTYIPNAHVMKLSFDIFCRVRISCVSCYFFFRRRIRFLCKTK